MDGNQDQHPPMQGDDELAKALQGGLQFEETPMPGANAVDAPSLSSMPAPDDNTTSTTTMTESPILPQPHGTDITAGLPADDTTAAPAAEEPTVKRPHEKDDDHKKTTVASTGNSELDKLKASALEELRPLVGKLNLPAEEKFDTLLLIIRTTDDQSLLDEAHAAAKEITDDTKRAQALLDVIKEIDYFSTKR